MGFLELFEKTIGSIHFIPGIYPYRMSLLTPLHFCVPSLVFGPVVAKYLAENGVSRIFLRNYWSIHYIPGIYPYGVTLLIPMQFRVPSLIFGPLVAKYLTENGASGIFWKSIGSIHFIPGIYTLMGWVSWPLYIFVFLASFSALWLPNIRPKMEFPDLKKNYWLNSFHTWHLPLKGESLDPYTFSCS